MDFHEICNFFGGTIFYDDLQGNLKDTQAQLDQLERETPLPSLDDSATLLLLQAVWHLHSGDLQEASALLECLIDAGIYGDRWAFRGSAYSALLYTWSEFPPLFKFCDLNGPAIVTWRRRFPKGRAFDALSYCANRLGSASIVDTIEFKVIKADCDMFHAVRGLALGLNPASEHYRDHADQRETHAGLVYAAKSRLKDLQLETLQLGLPAVAAYLSRLLYEICHIEGSQDARLHLEFMNTCYIQMQDQTGMGLYWLIRGDYNSSPSFTSPLILNFDIVDEPDEFGGDSRMFHSTGRYQAGHSGDLSRPYIGIEPAKRSSTSYWRRLIHKLMEKFPKSRRLTALITSKENEASRMSSDLKRRLSVGSDSLLEIPTSVQHDGDVETLLGVAKDQCKISGDMQLAKLVQLHHLLTGPLTYDSRLAARKLGTWAENSGSEVFGLCLGLLAFRAAMYFRYHCGSLYLSNKALETSRQLIKSMTMFRTLWFQVMLAQASISKSLGNLRSAKIWNRHLKNSWWQLGAGLLLNTTRGTVAEGPAEQDGMCLAIFQHFVKMTVGAIVVVDTQIGDPSSYPDAATQKMLDLIPPKENDPIAQHWVESQQLETKYRRTLATYKRLLADGNLSEANLRLQTFLESEDFASRNDLQARGHRIDIAMTLGLDDYAKDVLSLINDDDSLPRQYIGIGRGRSAEEKRYEKRRALKSLELIFMWCIRTEEWKRASRLLNLLESASPGFFTSVTSYTKLWPWQRCLYAGLVHEKEGQYNLANQYFLQSWLFAVEAQRSIGVQEDRRLMWESPDVARLVAALTRRFLRWKLDQPKTTKLEPTSDPRINTDVLPIFNMTVDYGRMEHYQEALLFLETGRAQYVWENSSTSVNLDLEAIENNYKYQKWLMLMSKDDRTEEEKSELLHLDAEKEQWTALLLQGGARSQPIMIRAREDMFPFQIGEIYEGIPANAIAIYPSLSDDGLALFAVDRTGIKIVCLIQETNAQSFRILVLAYLDEIVKTKGHPDSDSSQLDFLGSHLSELLIRPVENAIAKRDHVIFVPSGDLMRLPFGALAFKGGYLGLQRQVSQVPSLSTLRHLRLHRHVQTHSKDSSRVISVIARSGVVKNSHSPNERALPMAGIEAKLLGTLGGTKVMDAKDVSRTEFQSHLRSSSILHICTHGYSDTSYPMDSYIVLKERFRVLDMLAVRTELNLVVFSACLSGTGRASESGDLQGFSHAVLAAGANAYLGALWSVDDVATMIHMYHFYGALLVALDTPSFAEAWHFATKMLHEMSNEKVIILLNQFVHCWDEWEQRDEQPNAFLKGGKKKLQRLIRDLKTEGGAKLLNLKHPYFWAAFAMVGNGSMQIKSSRHDKFMKLIGQHHSDGSAE